MKRAIIYARVSTDEQARDNNSIGSQIKICGNYAQANGFEVIGDIQEDYSGYKWNRPGLQELLELVENKEIDAVIVKSSDRWSRRLTHKQQLRDILKRNDIELHYAQRGKIENTPEHRVVDNVEGSFDEYWRDKIIENTVRGKLEKAEIKGLFVQGAGPYGYRIDRYAPGGLAIVEDQARVVKEIFRLYCDGYSLAQVGKALMDAGYPAPKGGKKWGNSTIARILAYPVYIGHTYYNKCKVEDDGEDNIIRTVRDQSEWIKIKTQPIIDINTFNLVKQRLAENKVIRRRQPRRKYLFTGKIFCSHCEKVYGTETETPRRNRKKYTPIRYYRHRLTKGHCCNRHINGEKFESLIWKKITELLVNPDILFSGYSKALENEIAIHDKAFQRKDDLYTQATKLEKRKQNLYSMFSDPDIGMTKADLIAQKEPIDRALKDIELQLKGLEEELTNIPTQEQLDNFVKYTEKIRDRLLNPDWKPTFENKLYILNMLHVKIFIAPDGSGKVKGWIGEDIRFMYQQSPCAVILAQNQPRPRRRPHPTQ